MSPKIALAQYPITAFARWQDWQQHMAAWVAEAAGQGAQVLLFPEYGSMELSSLLSPALQNDLHGQIAGLQDLLPDWTETYRQLAREYQLIIIAPSIPLQEGAQVFNRTFVFGPGGLVGYQDKLFMTRFETESWGIDAGISGLSIFDCDWGSFGIQTCYDVEFPIGAHLLCSEGAQWIFTPSCTETLRGATRVHVGARARALENQCYVGVAQTIGEAPWSPAVDLNYGYAAAYSTPDLDFPERGILTEGIPQEPGWIYCQPDLAALQEVREQGQVLNQRDMQGIAMQYKGQAILIRRHKL